MVIFTLTLVGVENETESENWNFLNYGRIGKQSLYTRYYRNVDHRRKKVSSLKSVES